VRSIRRTQLSWLRKTRGRAIDQAGRLALLNEDKDARARTVQYEEHEEHEVKCALVSFKDFYDKRGPGGACREVGFMTRA
jgi:hypothetical protein